MAEHIQVQLLQTEEAQLKAKVVVMIIQTEDQAQGQQTEATALQTVVHLELTLLAHLVL